MAEVKTPTTDKEFIDKRILFMEGDFTEEACSKLAKEILLLSSHNEREDVVLYIDSFGGSAYEFLRIYSLLSVRPFKLKTAVIGKAMSAGAFLLLLGDERTAYPFSSIMLHEIASVHGFAKLHDLNDDMKETQRLQKIIVGLVRARTKIKNVEEFLQRDRHMDAKDALKLGVVDRIKKSTRNYNNC